MDRLRELEVLVEVAEAGSFVAAAARRNTSPPSITRTIAGLEDRLGIRLFNRTTRSLALTDSGARFLEHAKQLLVDFDQAEREAAGDSATPRGHLKVTASVTLGRMLLAPVVCGYLEAHPDVYVSALLFDRVVDLIEEGIDVGIRIGDLPDSSLRARKIGEVRRLLVASPHYLRDHGNPIKPTDLADHAMIQFTGLMPKSEWKYRDPNQAPARGRSVALQPRLQINDASAAIDAALNHDGITLALSYMVADHVKRGRLVPVLEPYAPPPVPVQLVYPEARQLAPKVRSFIDFAAPRLTKALAEPRGIKAKSR